MELLSILYQFLLLWFFLYIIVLTLQFLSTRKKDPVISSRRRPTNSVLPTFSIVTGDNYEMSMQRDQWSIKLFHVKYTTQRLNRLFHFLTKSAPNFWKVWFTCGAVTASLLMAISVVVIFVAAFKILLSLGHLIMPSRNTYNSNSLSKRDIDMTSDNEQVFLPMIPGITLPMSHIGYYLCALIICGLFHEAGHAIAAYSQGIHIQSSGMFVIYLYPGAFVNIPEQQLQNLNVFKQLRIICAGVWHNLILYFSTYLLLAGGLKILLLLLGWKSLEGQGGVSVVHVRSNSPLAAHIPPSTIIYQIDDFPLVNNINDWNHYLLNENGKHTIQQGFCVAQHEDQNYGTDCCRMNDEYPFGQSLNASISCFASYPFLPDSKKLCLTTVDVLSSLNPERCYKDTDCSSSKSCVIPYTPLVTGQVVRIYASFPEWNQQRLEPVDTVINEKVFIFEGELVDIWESVKVSLITPRYSFLPASIPYKMELLLRYISSFTLALAMLNILPAFRLDGEFALEQYLNIILKPLNDYNQVSTHETLRSPHKLHALIIKVTSYVVGFVIGGSILVGLLFSKV